MGNTPFIGRQGVPFSAPMSHYEITASSSVALKGNDFIVFNADAQMVVTATGNPKPGSVLRIFAANLTTDAKVTLPSGETFEGGSNTTVTLDADGEYVVLVKYSANKWLVEANPDTATFGTS